MIRLSNHDDELTVSPNRHLSTIARSKRFGSQHVLLMLMTTLDVPFWNKDQLLDLQQLGAGDRRARAL